MQSTSIPCFKSSPTALYALLPTSGELVLDFAKLIWQEVVDEQASVTSQRSVVGAGVNCTSPEHVAGALQILSAVAGTSDGRTCTTFAEQQPQSAISIVAYPNSGEEWDAMTRAWVTGTGCRGNDGTEEFGKMATAWYAAGARVVGGCCRTTTAHVEELNNALSALVHRGQ